MCYLSNWVKKMGKKLNNVVFSHSELMSGVFLLLFFITFIISLFIEIDLLWSLSLFGGFIAYLQLIIQYKDHLRWSWEQYCKCYKYIQEATDLLWLHGFDWNRNLSVIETGGERDEDYPKTIYPKFLEAVEIARVCLDEDTLKEVELIYEKARELYMIIETRKQREKVDEAIEISQELIRRFRGFYKLIRKNLAP